MIGRWHPHNVHVATGSLPRTHLLYKYHEVMRMPLKMKFNGVVAHTPVAWYHRPDRSVVAVWYPCDIEMITRRHVRVQCMPAGQQTVPTLLRPYNTVCVSTNIAIRSSQTKTKLQSNQTKTQTKPNQFKPSQAKPNQTKPN